MRPLRVLFLNSDDLVAQVRLLPMLDVLSASGRISVTAIDRDLNARGHRGGSFDVCIAHRNPGKRQIGWLRGRDLPLVYDLDDWLLSGKAGDSVRDCLQQASVVTAPSRHLLAEIDRKLNGGIAGKMAFIPNAGREDAPHSGSRSDKPNLIWMSSAIPQTGEGLMQVCRGIAEAAATMRTDTLMVGRFPQDILDALPRARCVPWVEPRDLLDWLVGRSLIAVAPLSTDLPATAQHFADCKSDIKIAQYGSCGIAGVYSNAVPYADSDLPRRLALRNDAASWTEEILSAAEAYPKEGAALAHHAAFAARRPSVLAMELFTRLEQAAGKRQPFTFKAIATPRFARIVEKRIRGWLR